MEFLPILENKRVMLRPLGPEDVDILLPVALQPELWTVGLNHIASREDLEKYIAAACQERTDRISIPLVIVDKKEGRIAGCTRYYEVSERHKRAEIGYTWIDTALQGTGLNKAMKYAMLLHAFEVMQLNRVSLKTDELNTRSRNAILSIGAKEEGIFRNHMITSKGRVRNTVFYSIIKEEWPEVKERIFGKYDF